MSTQIGTDRVPRLGLMLIVDLHTLVHLLHGDREKIRGQKNSSVVHENVQAFQKLPFTKKKTENLPPRCDTVSLIACTQACKQSEQQLWTIRQ